MRAVKLTDWIVYIVCACAPSICAAQHADSLLPPQLTPIAIDEPRAFPTAGPIGARPLMPAQPQPPAHFDSQPRAGQRPQTPASLRLTSAEQAGKTQSAKPPLRLAPRSDAGRPGVARPAAPTPTTALGTVVGSLAAVLGLFLVVVWCTRRFAPAAAAVLPKEALELLGRAPLTARQQLQLVRIGNKLLLVAISQAGIETLTEISDQTEVEHLTGLCKRGQAGSASAAFRQALTQLAAEPAPRGFVGTSRSPSRGAP
jgi:flagellar biogenesis protein FliO